MPIALNQLPDDIDALKSLVADLATKLDHFTARNEQLTTENQRYKTQVLTLTEQLNLALARRYAASSEKISPDQVRMFDEAEVDVEAVPDTDDEVLVPAHKRRKRGRKPLPDNLPRVDVVHEIPESERHCDHDGQLLVEIGEVISAQLDIIPAKIQVIRHVRKKYASNRHARSLMNCARGLMRRYCRCRHKRHGQGTELPEPRMGQADPLPGRWSPVDR